MGTFAKGAGSIRGQVSAWLHTVALRHALRVRKQRGLVLEPLSSGARTRTARQESWPVSD